MPKPSSAKSAEKPVSDRKTRAVPDLWVEPFLASISKGVSVGTASKLAGISRSAHTKRMEADTTYADQYKSAVADYIDSLEDRVTIGGSRPDADLKITLRVFEVRRPEIWGTKTKIEAKLEHAGTIGCPADNDLYEYANMFAGLKAELGVVEARAKDLGVHDKMFPTEATVAS